MSFSPRTDHNISLHLVTSGLRRNASVGGRRRFARKRRYLSVLERGLLVWVFFLDEAKFYPKAIENEGMRTDLAFVHFPMEDFEPFTSDGDLIAIVEFVSRAMWERRKRVFVHCWGGYGRTTMVVGLVMIWWKARRMIGGGVEEGWGEPSWGGRRGGGGRAFCQISWTCYTNFTNFDPTASTFVSCQKLKKNENRWKGARRE